MVFALRRDADDALRLRPRRRCSGDIDCRTRKLFRSCINDAKTDKASKRAEYLFVVPEDRGCVGCSVGCVLRELSFPARSLWRSDLYHQTRRGPASDRTRRDSIFHRGQAFASARNGAGIWNAATEVESIISIMEQ